MARLVQRLVEEPRRCSYLEEETAQLEMLVLLDVSPAELDHLLERGYRHFGPVFFRPMCAACTECVTLRIPVGSFVPSRSQRRAVRTARRFRREVAAPRVDDERLALYRAWHASREDARGWDESPVDAERYALDFAYPQPTAREVAFYDDGDGGKLVGLGIIDETSTALSAIYFFYEPTLSGVSMGVAHIMMLIEQARANGQPYVYLGYRVSGCPSLAYKSKFVPHELLEGRPDLRHLPLWRPAKRERERSVPASGDRRSP